MSSVTDVGGMIVSYSADISGLGNGITQAKSQMSSLVDAASISTTALKGMSGAADGSRIISNVDVAQARLTLLESKAAEARTALQELKDSGDAGQAVVGVPEAEAKLTLLEADAQHARQALKDMQTPISEGSGNFLTGIGGMISGVMHFTSQLGMMYIGFQQAAQMAQALADALIKPTTEFQAGMTSLVTGAGEAQKNLKLVGDGILNISTQTGSTTKDLIAGMYLIESAGYHGSAGIAALDAASRGAKVGAASLADVANGITTAMTDYSKSGLTAAQATNTLIATVAAGKTHMGDLANSMATILPTAASVGVSFTDVSGAMATMTGEGTPAAVAATYLRQMLMALENPASKSVSVLKEIGLTSSQVSTEMKTSLPNTLGMITDALAKKFPVGSAAYVKALADISGGTKQMQGMLQLTGDHLKVFGSNVTDIASSVKQGGSSITGWNKVTEDFTFKMDKAKATSEAFAIKLGTALLPAMGQLLDWVTPLITKFGDWATSSNGLFAILGSIGGAISNVVSVGAGIVNFFKQNELAALALLIPLGMISAVLVTMAATAFVAFLASIPAIVVGFIAWAGAATAAAIATIAATWPILAIGALIAIVVIGIILAVQHWGEITKWLSGVWGAFSSWFMGLLDGLGKWWAGVWKGIQTTGETVWNAIISFMQMAGQHLLDAITGPFVAIGQLFIWLYDHNTYFKRLIDFIVNIFNYGVNWLMFQWTTFSNWITGLWDGIVRGATIAWTLLYSEIKGLVMYAYNWLIFQWTLFKNWFTTLWNDVMTPVTKFWSWLGGVFTGAWNTYIAKPFNDIWTKVTKWFSDLGTHAYTSAGNFIQMLVNGINDGAGSIWNAVVGIANTIWKALGFHSPAKEGPGAEADQWMPNLVSMLSSQLIAGAPKMQAASNTVAQAIAYPIKPSATAVGASVGPSSSLQGSGGGGSNTYIFEMDGMELARMVGNNTDKLVRLKLGARSIRAA